MSDDEAGEELMAVAPGGPPSPWKKGEYVSAADEFTEMEKELARLIADPKTKAEFVGKRPHISGGIGGYRGDAYDEMEDGFFQVPGFEKTHAVGPAIPAHGGKPLPITNHHPNREWDSTLALKVATTGAFRPPPGDKSMHGGHTEFTNDRVYMESIHWADAKEYRNAMLRVASRKWNPKSDPSFMKDLKVKLEGAFDSELKKGFPMGFSPDKKPWAEFQSIPRMREKAVISADL